MQKINDVRSKIGGFSSYVALRAQRRLDMPKGHFGWEHTLVGSGEFRATTLSGGIWDFVVDFGLFRYHNILDS